MNTADEIRRRRTFAIISHPDAGKTTLTEKLLLYGGAILEAGSVKGKKANKHAVSDWMEIEKKRGISVSSSVMQFEYEDYCINILDTPGHQDFSEDTYRTLMAADSAVMVIDAGKGVEAQTKKLFKLCLMRHIPVFTFINKMDRAAMDPFVLMEHQQHRNDQPDEGCTCLHRRPAVIAQTGDLAGDFIHGKAIALLGGPARKRCHSHHTAEDAQQQVSFIGALEVAPNVFQTKTPLSFIGSPAQICFTRPQCQRGRILLHYVI